jgi:hypothetical protein
MRRDPHGARGTGRRGLRPLLGLALLAPGLAAAGPEKVAFPSDYKSHVLYAVVDRPFNETVRLFYVTPEAARAAKTGQRLPSGTVITMEVYKARVDEQGKPLKDSSGRFVRGDVVTIMVMEKRAGWGSEYPNDLRNGDWEYAQFAPDRTRAEPADSKPCLQCHKRMSGQDFVFSMPQLRTGPN